MPETQQPKQVTDVYEFIEGAFKFFPEAKFHCTFCGHKMGCPRNGYDLISTIPITITGWCWGCYDRFGKQSDAAQHKTFRLTLPDGNCVTNRSYTV